MSTQDPGTRNLTSSEVAEIFEVTRRTVTRWAREGRLNPIRTLGGHGSYPATQVRALMQGDPRTTSADLEALDAVCADVPPLPNEDAVLTPHQVAMVLRVDRASIWRWAEQGYLTPFHTRRGGYRRYLGADLLALLDEWEDAS